MNQISFKWENNKPKAYWSGEYVFYMKQTKGIPPEILEKELNGVWAKYSKQKRVQWLVGAGILDFIKQNKLNEYWNSYSGFLFWIRIIDSCYYD